MYDRTRSSPPIEAVVFDMDGVVTDTACAHAAAWKRTIDDFLRTRTEKYGEAFVPFEAEMDYRRYVDGRPRNRGVQCFLASRSLTLPFGQPDDPLDRETVCGLGNRKNAHFRRWLACHKVAAFPSSIALIRTLRQNGVKTAVYSASRNAEAVLRHSGILELFDAKVDGIDRDHLHLKGEPCPDVILETLSRLNVTAGHCVIVDDALPGVEAAKCIVPALVVGVNRSDYADELRAKGSDIVVNDLGELRFDLQRGLTLKTIAGLASPLADLPSLMQRLFNKRLAVFLDYDGTLTPIVDDPNCATLSTETRQTLQALAERHIVAVISGRDLAEIRWLVSIDTLYYAGSHGFDIEGPKGRPGSLQVGIDFLPDLDRAERDLRERLQTLPGIVVERKRFAISIHYRHAREADLAAVEASISDAAPEDGRLRKSHGKKVFQIQPRLAWNKGKALLWLLQWLGLQRPDVAPIYIGDDLTDEDAFRVVLACGLGVVVRDGDRPTAAEYALADPHEVERFLQTLISMDNGND